MKSLISKKRLTERKKEERRKKQSLDSPQTIEANKKLTSSVLGQIVFGIFDNSLKFSPLRNMCQKFGHNRKMKQSVTSNPTKDGKKFLAV